MARKTARWIFRCSVGLGGLFVLAVLAVQLLGGALIERLIRSALDERGAMLEGVQMGIHLSGVEIGVARYAEAGFSFEGLSLSSNWGQLWSVRAGVSARLRADLVELVVPRVTGGTRAETAINLDGSLRDWVGRLSSIPIATLEVDVRRLEMTDGLRTLSGRLEGTLLWSEANGHYLMAGLESDFIDLNLEGQLSVDGVGIALELSVVARDWPRFRAELLPELAGLGDDNLPEVLIRPLGGGAEYLRAQGFFHWKDSDSKAAGVSAFFEIGPPEVRWDGGGFHFGKIHLGVVADFDGEVRVVAGGGLDLLRWGEWVEFGGRWNLKTEGATLLGELEIGPEVSISLAFENWLELLRLGAADVFLEERGPLRVEASVGTWNLAGVDLRNVRLAGSGGLDGLVRVDQGRVEVGGGIVAVEPLEFRLGRGAVIRPKARLESLDMQILANFFPQFKGELEGRISGGLDFVWEDGRLGLSGGQLAAEAETETRLRYKATGLFTTGIDPRSGSFRQYRMAETAFENLLLQRFVVDFFPTGLGRRLIRVEFFGESEQSGLVVPIDFGLNLNVDEMDGLLDLLKRVQAGQLEFR